MQLDDIKLFIWAAQLQSFSLTGKHFDIPRQTVSRRISQLEEELGVRLLQRTTRRIELTDLGREFLNRWLHILEEIEYTQQVITERQTKPKGRVRMAVPNEFGTLVVGEWLPELAERYPELEVMLYTTEGTGQSPDLNLDLLVHIGRPQDSSFIGFSLGTLYRKFYASPAFLERHGSPAHPRELANFPCILYPVMGEPDKLWRWSDEQGSHSVEVQGQLGSDITGFARRMAERGLGIAWLPEFMVREPIDEGSLVPLFDGQYGTPYEMFVMYASRTFIPAKTQVVIDFLKERIKDKLDLSERYTP